ncbi:MAG: hypothetical protein A3F14_03135 [Gammaproteobacteria bacterium RIFCSPHIGHO2_12_FULL_43_28]|nr:MAG: hypothetical protein A3F14_03135 [Gammaproteobacteria bacterium RIFCSPHIGHO2_12_FULL_43_28]
MKEALTQLIDQINQHPEIVDVDKRCFIEIIEYRTRHLDEFYLVYKRISPCIDKIKKREMVTDADKISWDELGALRDVVSLMPIFEVLTKLKLLHSQHGAYDLYKKVEECFEIANVLGLDVKHDVPGMRFFQYNHYSREYFFDTIALFDYLRTLIKSDDNLPSHEKRP